MHYTPHMGSVFMKIKEYLKKNANNVFSPNLVVGYLLISVCEYNATAMLVQVEVEVAL